MTTVVAMHYYITTVNNHLCISEHCATRDTSCQPYTMLDQQLLA